MIYPQAMWADVIARKAGITRGLAKQVIRIIGEETQRRIADGENVRLFGIGRIEIVERNARIGRNKANGFAPIQIPACKKVKFLPSSALAKAARDSKP